MFAHRIAVSQQIALCFVSKQVNLTRAEQIYCTLRLYVPQISNCPQQTNTTESLTGITKTHLFIKLI